MFYLILASLLWSLSFGLIKAQISSLDPFLVSTLRLGLSALVFLPWLRRVPPRLLVSLLVIGMVQFGLMYAAYLASFRDLHGHQIALLTTTTPIFVVLTELAWARRASLAVVAAGALAVFAGLVVVYKPGAATPALFGLLLMQLSNICFAVGQVSYRRLKLAGAFVRDESVFGWLYIGAMVPPLVFLAVFEAPLFWPRGVAQWASIAYLGLLPSAVAFFAWNKGAAKVGAGTVAAMNNAKIPGAVLLAWLLFGEEVSLTRVLGGGALLALALWLAHRYGARATRAACPLPRAELSPDRG